MTFSHDSTTGFPFHSTTAKVQSPIATCTLHRRRSLFDQFWTKNANTSDKISFYSRRTRAVKFNPKVSVLEYPLSLLDSGLIKEKDPYEKQIEIEEAKQRVLSLLRGHCRTVYEVKMYCCISKFSSPMLKVTPEDQVILSNSVDFRYLLERSIRRVLVVDSHNAFLNLYVRGLASILPDIPVATTRTGEDALQLIAQRCGADGTFPFDVVIVDHKLLWGDQMECKSSEDGCMTGAGILRQISEMDIDIGNQPLLIGTSMSLKADGSRLASSGADFIWGKPPPPMTKALRNELLNSLLNKRAGGESNIVIL
jgi:CheY-like chemotaxis protein